MSNGTTDLHMSVSNGTDVGRHKSLTGSIWRTRRTRNVLNSACQTVWKRSHQHKHRSPPVWNAAPILLKPHVLHFQLIILNKYYFYSTTLIFFI